MKQIKKWLERLEQAADKGGEQLDITIKLIGVDNSGNSYIAGGLHILPGSEQKQLPASYFDKEENHNEA